MSILYVYIQLYTYSEHFVYIYILCVFCKAINLTFELTRCALHLDPMMGHRWAMWVCGPSSGPCWVI